MNIVEGAGAGARDENLQMQNRAAVRHGTPDTEELDVGCAGSQFDRTGTFVCRLRGALGEDGNDAERGTGVHKGPSRNLAQAPLL